MAIIQVPTPCYHDSLITALNNAGLLTEPSETIAVHLPDTSLVYPSAIAFLAAWGLHQRAAYDTRLVVTGDDQSRRYLSRMDLLAALDSPFTENFERRPAAGRFLPVTLIDSDEACKFTVDSICDLVLHQFENPRPFLPALEWAVSEITDNILLHAQTETPGVVCAQYFDSKHRLDVAIVDTGRGLKASLEESMHVWSHGDAITKAIKRGVTRDTDVGMGNGLAGTLEIARVNGGEFHIWSGDVTFRVVAGRDRGFATHAFVPGTGIFLSLDTRRPVDLSTTFIQGNAAPVIHTRIEFGGIRVNDEVEHTGSRPPATHLRRKILNLLSETEEPLTLDFSGVIRASSSFLDELLGRLVKELGVESFQKKVKVILTVRSNLEVNPRLR